MKKKKPQYSLLNNLAYILGLMWEDKVQTVIVFLRGPVLVLTSLLSIYLSREAVAAVTQNQAPETILLKLGLISLLLTLLIAVQKHFEFNLSYFMVHFDDRLQKMILEKCVAADYENIESPDGLTRADKATESIGSSDRGARQIANVLSSMTANIIGIITYAGLLLALSPWILSVVAATTVAGFWLMNLPSKWNYRNKDSWKTYDRKLDYLHASAGDFTKAKDIRLYGMGEWLGSVFYTTLSGRMAWHKREELYQFKNDGLRALLSLLRDGVSYGLLVYFLYEKNLPAADFILYFGVIGGFASWMDGTAEAFSKLNRFHLGFCELREFLDYPDKANHGDGIPLPTEAFSIEFTGVSYRHAGNEDDTIKNLSFKIEKGEKLAIVGPNGAGKTTLVKLISGLYTPTEGEILIDGNPVSDYNREEYYSLFSVVFQDIYIIPVSIARNISAEIQEATDRGRVIDTLKKAGLYEKTESLPGGIDTRLIKSIYDDAVDLSGGELQKLALARALYKKGKALILDEPTAALDPIAESAIYRQYNAMTEGITSVFISHRLASTRFCDRIIYLDNGRIIETGTHEELMTERGNYYAMFEAQSHYYREEEANVCKG